MTYRVLLEGRSVDDVSDADIAELQRLLQPVRGRVSAGKASSEAVRTMMHNWAGRRGIRGRRTREVMGRLDRQRMQELESGYPSWWSADVEVEGLTVEQAREAAVSSVVEALRASGRSRWSVLHSEVRVKRWFGTVGHAQSGAVAFPLS